MHQSKDKAAEERARCADITKTTALLRKHVFTISNFLEEQQLYHILHLFSAAVPRTLHVSGK